MSTPPPTTEPTDTVEDLAETGKVEKRLSAVERVQLQRRLAAARYGPPKSRRSWKQLAKKEGMPVSTLQYNLKHYDAKLDLLADPTGVVEESLLIYGEAMDELAEVAVAADNSSARIGAIRSLIDATRGRLELLAALNRLGIGEQQAESRLNAVLDEMLDVLGAHDAEPELLNDLAKVIDKARGVQTKQIEVAPVIEQSRNGA